MKIKTKKMEALILAVVAAVSVTGGIKPALVKAESSEEKVIRVGGPGSEEAALNMELMNVAYRQGYLEDELKKAGYQLEFTLFAGAGPALNEALASDELDVVTYGDLPAFVGKSNGVDTTIIASVNSDLQYGIVAANDKIKEAKDLEGKNVIVPEGTAIQYFWENYAREKGIDTDKVNIINAAEDAASLLMTGDADAVVSTLCGAESYVHAGVGEIIDTGAGLEDTSSSYVVAAKSTYLEDNPDAAVAINKALIESYQAVLKDENVLYESSEGQSLPAEEWKNVYAYDTSFSYLTPEITSSEKDYWEKFDQWLVDHKLLKEAVDLDQFVDTSYYNEAKKQLENTEAQK